MTVSTTKKQIQQKIAAALAPCHLSIIDETWKHAGHAGAISGKGHFIIHLVSEQFEGVSLLNRNRMVFDLLKVEMETLIHALTLRAQTPSEWEMGKGSATPAASG